MVEYSSQTSRGDPISADYHLSIYQYPNNSGDDTECKNVMLDALTGFCDQLYENTQVDYYEISITYKHPWIGDNDSTAKQMKNDFRSWLSGRNPPRGSHLLVTDFVSYGYADLGNGGPTSFNDWLACVMGTELAEQFWKNGGIHEVAHNLVDKNSVTGSYIEDEQHDLGKVYNQTGDPASPMCTSYEHEHGPHGDCNNDAFFDQAYTTTVTQCTLDAIDQTARDYS
jgi:hypothetical protein